MAEITLSCPAWEYDKIPEYEAVLHPRAVRWLLFMRGSTAGEVLARARDTRPLHGSLFDGLTPKGVEYYAGNYRGSDFFCLRDYEVQVPGDRRVGHVPATVPIEMTAIEYRIALAAAEMDFVWLSNADLKQAEKLYRIVELATALFVDFLEIHPYANGNGHAARFLLIALLARCQIFPSRWQLHPRPADPPYSDLIRIYRSGTTRPLVRFVLSCI